MIIGLTGFIGCGKTQVAAELVLEHGFLKLACGDEVRAEAERREIPNNRANLQQLGDELRKELGGDIWVKRLVKRIQANEKYVIEGLRNPEEITYLKTLPEFCLVYIDAPQEIRAHRILSRARFGDPQTIEEFTIADERDQGINQQGFGQNTAKVVVLADKKIINDGDLISLSKQIGELVASLRQ